MRVGGHGQRGLTLLKLCGLCGLDRSCGRTERASGVPTLSAPSAPRAPTVMIEPDTPARAEPHAFGLQRQSLDEIAAAGGRGGRRLRVLQRRVFKMEVESLITKDISYVTDGGEATV